MCERDEGLAGGDGSYDLKGEGDGECVDRFNVGQDRENGITDEPTGSGGHGSDVHGYVGPRLLNI